jgi:hypothetical protein
VGSIDNRCNNILCMCLPTARAGSPKGSSWSSYQHPRYLSPLLYIPPCLPAQRGWAPLSKSDGSQGPGEGGGEELPPLPKEAQQQAQQQQQAEATASSTESSEEEGDVMVRVPPASHVPAESLWPLVQHTQNPQVHMQKPASTCCNYPNHPALAVHARRCENHWMGPAHHAQHATFAGGLHGVPGRGGASKAGAQDHAFVAARADGQASIAAAGGSGQWGGGGGGRRSRGEEAG